MPTPNDKAWGGFWGSLLSSDAVEHISEADWGEVGSVLL